MRMDGPVISMEVLIVCGVDEAGRREVLPVEPILAYFSPEIGLASFRITNANLLEMLSVIPSIFLLGLLDVWVEKETMIRYLGK